MEKFIERLLNEETELNARKAKLQKFIDSENFKDVDPTQKALLNVQLKAMDTYSECLNERIKHLNNQ